ncbi:MAG: CHAT domain-containing protein [Acidobacteria bacterium]|nr:CHAT domain-containing protein [Acidobacteriota bacterium]
MRWTPHLRLIPAGLLLSFLACTGCTRLLFETRLERLLHKGDAGRDELLVVIKRNRQTVKSILSHRMDKWIRLAEEKEGTQALSVLRDTLALANALDKISAGAYQSFFEARLFLLLSGKREVALMALMKQDPDMVRDILKKRLDTCTDLEWKGDRARAHADLQDTLALAGAFEKLTESGLWTFVQTRTSKPLEQRLAIREVESLITRGWDLLRAGQPGKALAEADGALAAGRKEGDACVEALAHLLRAQALFNLHRVREAQEPFEMSHRLFLQQGFKSAAAAVQSDLGMIYVRLGRLSDAVRLYRSVLVDLRRMYCLRHVASTLNHLGALYVQMGDLNKGLETHHETLTIEEQIHDEWTLPRTLNNLGQAYYTQGNYALAEDYSIKALAAARIGHDTAITGIALNNLGELYFRKGLHELSFKHLTDALEVKRAGKSSAYDQAWTLRALGEFSLTTDQVAEADHYIQKALSEIGQMEDMGAPGAVLEATVCNLQGKLWLRRGHPQEAARAFGDAIAVVEKKLGNMEAQHWKTILLSSMQDLYHDMILLQRERLTDSVTAFDFAEKARARSFLDLIGRQVQLEYGTALAPGGVRRLDDVLSTSHVQPLRWRDLQRRLPDNVTVIAYTVTKNQLLIWVLDSTGVQSRAILLSEETLENRVMKFNEAVTLNSPEFIRRFPTWEDRLRELHLRGADLYRYLIEPVKEFLHEDRLICFVPDGKLYYVPFAALIDPTEKQYLVEKYTLFYAASASILVEALALQDGRKSAKPLLLVSNPLIGDEVQQAYPLLRPLRDAERSDRAIVDLYSDGCLMGGAQAHKAAIQEAMPNYAVIHFSTHSVLDDRDPLHSSLILAPGERLPRFTDTHGNGDPVKRDNGQLFAHDIFRLKLPRTQLLTLSACETALGRLWRGEGMIGMVRAAFSAGVPSIIVTQWKIEDESAGQLMLEFYKRLRGQVNIAGALTGAQRSRLQEAKHIRERHPFYWGGFCLMGSYRLSAADHNQTTHQ